VKRAFLLLVLVMTGCGSPSSQGLVSASTTAAPVTSATAPLTSASVAPVTTAQALLTQALGARADFLAVFWDPTHDDYFTNSDHQVDPTHGALYSDFWWGAHLLETTLDAYDLTGAASERKLVDDHYDGFTATHDWTKNAYNDDLCWWALALAHAYEATGEARFRDRAASIFQSIAAFEDQTYGGGVWWKRDGTGTGKNVCINGPYVMTALHLYAWTGDASYLDRARAVQAWLTARLATGGNVLDTVHGTGSGTATTVQLTYNYGTYLGASLALFDATGDATFLADANAAADRAVATLTVNGVLRDEGRNDGAGFKMILTRYLVKLAQHGAPRFATFLAANADAAWSNRRADGLMDHDWTHPAPATPIQSFAAASAVSVQLHALLALAPAPAPPARTAVPAFMNVTIAADQATRHALSLESKYAGFTGTGYVAGWDQDGEWVDFAVNVPAAGDYVVELRYAAGAGDASRYLYANGAGVVSNQAFPATGAWTEYRSTSAIVSLRAGANVISVIYDSSRGSSSYLNLDAITVAPSPAR
jgi:predicted alpha-1,6-mannanase (GH76 family)